MSNESPLKNILYQWMHGKKYRDKLLGLRIEEIWQNQWGNAFGRYTQELRFQKGILYIHLNSSVLRHELHLQRNLLKDKINEALGEDAIIELRVQ